MNFSKNLINWYSVNKRKLPWRETQDPYFIWLSEIILQQTQVKQGWPYYTAFTLKFPTVFDLAAAKEEDVLNLWQGLGYYSRARNLHTSAKYIVEVLNGVFPNTYVDLKKLKGVGDYTASAIASICYNEKTAVVDGNVYRVLSRIFGIDTPINSTNGIKEFKALAQELLDKKKPAAFNQAIMDYGSQVCKPKQPLCGKCVFNPKCIAFNKNKVNVLPVKLKKTKITTKFFNFLVVLNEDNVVLEKRIGKGIWQNLYQFPLYITLSETETPDVSLHIKDELHLNDFELSLYNTKPLIHKLSHQHLHTKFWIVNTQEKLSESIKINQLQDFPVPVLIENFIKAFNF
ncbi:A/G-specific adenine glycosylase [Aurantibacter sp.]|uniref:A/G-specific adenine glycosylase n=1 Tax=Flavobacteriaceae TaxID=49546 RepID=UPI0035C7BED2